jgi:hypothetical protein
MIDPAASRGGGENAEREPEDDAKQGRRRRQLECRGKDTDEILEHRPR